MGLTAEEEVPDEKTFPDDEIVLPEALINSSGEQVEKEVLEKKFVEK